ncbi:MAG: hypothetical protein PHC29_07615 [Candidatus Omnitrophica bacterium]|nr:hypothetical protein [Candidatus Omnitrophota bacterium]
MKYNYFMQTLISIIGQLLISIVGGIISGLIVTWLLKQELAKVISKDAIKRLLKKEIFIVILVIILMVVYVALVNKGILPKPEFKDYLIVYDEKGNEYLYDGKEKIPTGVVNPMTPDVIEVPGVKTSAKDIVGGVTVEVTQGDSKTEKEILDNK